MKVIVRWRLRQDACIMGGTLPAPLPFKGL